MKRFALIRTILHIKERDETGTETLLYVKMEAIGLREGTALFDEKRLKKTKFWYCVSTAGIACGLVLCVLFCLLACLVCYGVLPWNPVMLWTLVGAAVVSLVIAIAVSLFANYKLRDHSSDDTEESVLCRERV